MNEGCEAAITRTGWGPCHHFLVIICGLCTLAEATASLIVIVVSPLLACDLKFDKNSVMQLNAISSLGMAFGGFLFGTAVDVNGRKGSIPTSMVVVFVASVYLSFAHKFMYISFAVFLLGVGIAGNNVALRVYLVECLPAKRRGASLAMLDLLWVVGYLVALGISWSLVPSVVQMLGNEFRPSSWRVLAGLGGAPSLIMACVASLLPSSPRYLLHRRHPERALAVLQHIYAVNNSRHVDQYPPCELEGCISPDENEYDEGDGCLQTIRRCFKKIWKKMEIIFSSGFVRTTIFTIITRLCLFPGLIWLAVWKAHLSMREDEYSSEGSMDFIVGDNSSECVVDAGDMAQSFLRDCHGANGSTFEHTLLISTSYVMGEVLLVVGIDAVGRRMSIVTSGMVGVTAMLGLIRTNRHYVRMLLSILFLASYSVIYTATSVALVEAYPTSVRGTVVGVTSVLPHLAGFLVKFSSSICCVKSIYVATGLIIGAALAAMPIPDRTRLPMQE